MTKIEKILGYCFKNSLLLEEALTHPSVSREHPELGHVFNYERLEFLGDAVLGLVIAECLLDKYPEEKEGALAKRQAGLVKGESVASIAERLDIGQHINMTPGEESMGGRKNKNNIENALEALIGAIYQDSGLEPAKSFILEHWSGLIDEMIEPPKDPKTALQEWAQGKGLPIPLYKTVDTAGPSHAPSFTVEVIVEGVEVVQSSGDSKKKAEKEAASILLEKIQKMDD